MEFDEPARAELTHYAERPLAFLGRYIRRRGLAHAAILAAVLIAVGCAVGSQYGLKSLVDALSGPRAGAALWGAFALLVALIAGDNLFWRLAGWLANYTFVAVTVDLRADLFRHLTGHAPSYFADRMPGTLASRITATSNAVYAVENHVHLERVAALRCNRGFNRLSRDGQPAR